MSGDRYFTYKTLSNEHILEKVRGVIHVGANYGQEREVYDRHKLHVLWFEPIPSVFRELLNNLSGLVFQDAYRFLVWDTPGIDIPFHVTDNEGQSSSALELHRHKELWPDVHHGETITVPKTSLNVIFDHRPFFLAKFDFLVIDAQGAELKVLTGATDILPRMKYVQIEATDCELYKGCAQLPEIDAFMREHGFKEMGRTSFSPRPDIGNCYEVLYERI
jgi:FkbM family methyltransferase